MKNFTAFAASLLTLAANAGTVDFSYSDLSEPPLVWGTGKNEVYDVAIRLGASALEGKKIREISVFFPAADVTSDYTGWLTTELKLENKVNVADLASVEATVTDSVLHAVFPEPVEIPAGGLYAGYSFAVSSLTDESKKPIGVTIGENTDGLYIHSKRTYLKWKSVSTTLGGVSSMVVTIDGDFGPVDVAIGGPETAYVGLDKDTWEIPVTLNCYGVDAIESLEWTLTAPELEPISTVQHISEAIQPQFGKAFPIAVTLPTSIELGGYDATLTLSRVNGMENPNASNFAQMYVQALPKIPVHRPLLEEYTGLWCGWCVRGYGALEYLSKTYPNDFVCAAYHDGDLMQTEAQRPGMVDGYPNSWLDRTLKADPFLGSSQNGFGMLDDWQNHRANFAPCSVDIVTEENDGKITATATVEFVLIPEWEDRYDVEFILVGDGLKHKDFIQHNYFPGYYKYPTFGIEELDQFCNGGKYGEAEVSGLAFNDVVLARSEKTHLSDGNPVNVGEAYQVSTTFNPYDVWQNYDPDNPLCLGKVAESFHVIAVVTEKSFGDVVNSIRSGQSDSSGIKPISVADVLSTEWYDLQGRRISDQSKGLGIRVDRLSDGTVRTSKVIR